MLKKILSVLLAAAVCAGFAGCSSKTGTYGEVRKAQEAVASLESGKILVTAGYEKGGQADRTVTEFSFKLTESGNYEYCQTQFDQSNKAVYCEYSDGEKSEQWLVGSGWNSVGTTVYNKENPHRYLKLLSTPFEKKAVESCKQTEEGNSRCYTIVLKPKKLNETVYENTDVTVKSETVRVLVDSAGIIAGYSDEAELFDQQENADCFYTLDMQLSEINAVAEITKPDLRDNFK